jgi:hypothetical protein
MGDNLFAICDSPKVLSEFFKLSHTSLDNFAKTSSEVASTWKRWLSTPHRKYGNVSCRGESAGDPGLSASSDPTPASTPMGRHDTGP